MSSLARRLRIGRLPVDVVTRDEALNRIDALVAARQGGYVVTPNIDHVVVAETNEPFFQAYEHASLSLVDGQPLMWASRLLREPFPEKISGADLILPLMRRAAEKKYRVYLLGAGPGVAEKAAEILRRDTGVNIVGTDSPRISVDPQAPENEAPLAKVRAAKPDLLLLALGAPKQELWMHHLKSQYAPAVAFGIGAGLDFIAGTVKRAPAWMSRSGLEWAYRLSQEPGRLWRRYLVNDPKFVLILARELRQPASARVELRQGP